MRIDFHPEADLDVSAVVSYYERTGNERTADDFLHELRRFIQQAADRPQTYAVRERDIRRVNLRKFPYHFLFRIKGDAVRILAVCHNRREPSFGMERE